jgi:hypothetical protein
MTTSVDPTLTKIEGLFKSLVWDNLVAALMVQVPALKFWPLSAIALFITDKLYSLIQLGIDVGAISLLDAQAASEFSRQEVELQILATEKGMDSPEFKKAKQDAKTALAQFLQFRG